MTDRQLDAKCAEILGWTNFRAAHEWLGETHASPPPSYKCHPQTTLRVPEYSTSLDAARELLEWVNDKSEGEIREFTEKVIRLVGSTEYDHVLIAFDLMLPKPRQIAEAFVETFGGTQLEHGKNCRKVPHTTTGYLHGQDDDTPYTVDGVSYCGRCHTCL